MAGAYFHAMNTTTNASKPASKSLTKAEEIALLDSIIAQFGTNSYIGVTLADQREAIVQCIRCDIAPLQLEELRAEHRDLQIATRDAEKQAFETGQRVNALKQQEASLLERVRSIDDQRLRKIGHFREEARNALRALRDMTETMGD